jgi:hypothetical protein
MIKNKHLIDDNFDYWLALSKKKPEVFEVRRAACIEALISSAPDSQQPRLRGLQWQIDLKRKRAKTPMAACITISNMMWDRVLGEGGLLESLRQTRSPTLVKEQEDEEMLDSASILPFVLRSEAKEPLHL